MEAASSRVREDPCRNESDRGASAGPQGNPTGACYSSCLEEEAQRERFPRLEPHGSAETELGFELRSGWLQAGSVLVRQPASSCVLGRALRAAPGRGSACRDPFAHSSSAVLVWFACVLSDI